MFLRLRSTGASLLLLRELLQEPALTQHKRPFVDWVSELDAAGIYGFIADLVEAGEDTTDVRRDDREELDVDVGLAVEEVSPDGSGEDRVAFAEALVEAGRHAAVLLVQGFEVAFALLAARELLVRQSTSGGGGGGAGREMGRNQIMP